MRALRDNGASLVDALVGLVIGLLSLVIVHQVFVAIDAVRRNATAAADAQSAGALALYLLASQIGNAGAGIAAAAPWLDTCPPTADVAATLRPISVLISDGGAADRPDSLVIRQSLAPVTAVAAAFAGAAPAGSSFRVESPDGFAVGDRIVAVGRNDTCAASRVTAVSAATAGIVDIAHAPVAVDLPMTGVLLNLGPAGSASTSRYDVVSGTLRSTDLANGDAPAPVVANIVNLKLRYGIDSDGDGALDTWVAAGPSGDWSAAALLAAPRATLARIKAIRVGIVVRSDVPDRSLTDSFHWVLFDCEASDKATCPGRVEGTIAAAASGGYRYRTHETIVPLRNVIWNSGP